MINDINIGGVFIPGLLVTALIALVCTLFIMPLLSCSRLYRRLPFRPKRAIATTGNRKAGKPGRREDQEIRELGNQGAGKSDHMTPCHSQMGESVSYCWRRV